MLSFQSIHGEPGSAFFLNSALDNVAPIANYCSVLTTTLTSGVATATLP